MLAFLQPDFAEKKTLCPGRAYRQAGEVPSGSSQMDVLLLTVSAVRCCVVGIPTSRWRSEPSMPSVAVHAGSPRQLAANPSYVRLYQRAMNQRATSCPGGPRDGGIERCDSLVLVGNGRARRAATL